jgi:hypothetical protein
MAVKSNLMALSRRKFIIGSLALIASPIVYKIITPKFLINDGLEDFLNNYEGIVALNSSSEFNCPNGIVLFEEKLRLILKNNPQKSNWIEEINDLIYQDYQNSKVELTDGWVLSETELCIEILRSKYV